MADEKWNAYRGAARDAAARVDAKKGIKTTREAQDPMAHAQTPHHTNTISSYKDTPDRGRSDYANVPNGTVPMDDPNLSGGDYDSEPIPHNVRGQQAYRDRGYY
jgi:hypothetical protein